MIIVFPSTMQSFDVLKPIPKNTFMNWGSDAGQRYIELYAPVDLKPADQVWIDMRTGLVHIIQRDGIAIWRSGWKN